MRIVALAILMALISVQTAGAVVTFGRDRLQATTKTQLPVCPAGTTLTKHGTDDLCIVKLGCPAGTTLQGADLCVAKPKCPVATDVIKDGACVPA